jgi:transcriptional regulator with XRE-family HTH domain
LRTYESVELNGSKLSLEALSKRIGVSTSTLSRLWSAKSGVDRKTLHLLFSTFNLTLTEEDIQQVATELSPLSKGPNFEACNQTIDNSGPVLYPTGPLPADSPRYVHRSGVEDRVFQEVVQPGSFLRISGPDGYGKTSLLYRLQRYVRSLSFADVVVNIQQVDQDILSDPSDFLKWLCAFISFQLSIQNTITESWDPLLGCKLNTSLYIQNHVLTQIEYPLFLAIDSLEFIFSYPKTAQTILPLLRSWYEEAQQDTTWQRLRLAVFYSTECYLPFDINQSPFNVGMPIRLDSFDQAEMQSLLNLDSIRLNEQDLADLLLLTGGNPLLANLALYHLRKGLTTDELLDMSNDLGGVYHTFLQKMLAQVANCQEWTALIKQMLANHEPIYLDPIIAYKLEGIGLIKQVKQGRWYFSCELYRLFFQTYLD